MPKQKDTDPKIGHARQKRVDLHHGWKMPLNDCDVENCSYRKHNCQDENNFSSGPTNPRISLLSQLTVSCVLPFCTSLRVSRYVRQGSSVPGLGVSPSGIALEISSLTDRGANYSVAFLVTSEAPKSQFAWRGHNESSSRNSQAEIWIRVTTIACYNLLTISAQFIDFKQSQNRFLLEIASQTLQVDYLLINAWRRTLFTPRAESEGKAPQVHCSHRDASVRSPGCQWPERGRFQRPTRRGACCHRHIRIALR